MAFNEAQLKSLEAKLGMPNMSGRCGSTTLPSPMSKVGTSSPKQIASVDTVRTINKHTTRSTPRGAIAQNLVAHMKGRAIALAKQGNQASSVAPDNQNWSRPRVDKSVLAIAEPKRIRSKEHLRFVARHSP